MSIEREREALPPWKHVAEPVERYPYTLKQSLEELAAENPEAAAKIKPALKWAKWLGIGLAALLFAAIVLSFVFPGPLMTVMSATLMAGAITLGSFIDVPFARAIRNVEPLTRLQRRIVSRRTRLLRAGAALIGIGAVVYFAAPGLLALPLATTWSVSGPLMLAGFMLPMVAPLTTLSLSRRVRRFRGELCPGCAYRLEGLPAAGICPECGEAYEREAARQSWSRTFNRPVNGYREIRSDSQAVVKHIRPGRT